MLIYFVDDVKAKVIEYLFERVAPGGFLFFGHAEGWQGFAGRARSVAPNVYQRNHDRTNQSSSVASMRA